MIKYDFGTKYTFSAKTDTTEIDVRVDAETLDEIVDAFTSFLRAAGFYIDGEFVIERFDSRDDDSADLVGFPKETDGVVGLTEEDYEEVLVNLSETVRAWFDTPEYRAAEKLINKDISVEPDYQCIQCSWNGTVDEARFDENDNHICPECGSHVEMFLGVENFKLGEVFTFDATDKLSIIKERN